MATYVAENTITLFLNTTLVVTGNTAPVSLVSTLPSGDYADAVTAVMQITKSGGIFTDSRHFFPATSIQYVEIT